MSISLRNSCVGLPQLRRRCRAGRSVGGVVDVPGVGAFFAEEVDDALVDLRVVEGLVALFAEEDGDGDAPDALAGDAPVGAGGDHVGDALFAPGGIPDDLLDLVEGALAEGGGRRGLSSVIESWGFPCR